MKFLAIAAVTLLATACQALPTGFGPATPHDSMDYMTGRLSTVRSFDDNLSINELSLAGTDAYFNLHVEGRYGWVMLNGGVDTSGHEVGETWELSEEELWSMVGCAGPQPYDYDFDNSPEDVSVGLSWADETPGFEGADPDAVVVTIDADFGSTGSVTAVAQTVPLR